jgi:hypothetical protein
MESSSEIKDLAAALAKAQAEFPDIPKDKTAGKPGDKFTYKYADLATILKATRPLLTKNGLVVSQLVGADSEGNGTLTTMLIHSSGQFLKDTIIFNLGNKMQETGSAITYLRRYSVSAILGVASEDDTDGEGAAEQKTQSRAAPPRQASAATPSKPLAAEMPTSAMLMELTSLSSKLPSDIYDEYLMKLEKQGVKSDKDFTMSSYRKARDWVEQQMGAVYRGKN